MTPTRYRLLGGGPHAPVIVERSGGGLIRPSTVPESDSSLRRLTRAGSRALACDRAGIWRVEVDGSRPICLSRFVQPAGRHEEYREYPDEMGRHTLEVLQRIAYLAMEDVECAAPPAPPLRRYLESEGVRALLAVPTRVGDDLKGFVTFESLSGPRRWSENDRDTARELARQVESLWSGAGLGSGSQDMQRSAGPPQDDPTDGRPPEEYTAPEEANGKGGAASRRALPDSSLRLHAEADLRLGLRRLRPLEAAGILGLDTARAVAHLLEVQDGGLSLLEEAVGGTEDASGAREQFHDARRANELARERLYHHQRSCREGRAAHRTLELNALLGGLAARLGKLTGDRVPLLVSPSSSPLVVRGHPHLLPRAIEHLVRNAREASAEGSRVRVGILASTEGRGPEHAGIVVEDRGEGIARGDLPWVFEPYFTTRSSDGAEGLGLPFVQAVVEEHEGWVDVESTRGRGTTVTLHLPLAESPRDRADDAEGAPGADPRPLALVVEDDPFLSRLLARSLNRGGFRVQRVESRTGAERVLRELEGRVELLLSERRLLDGAKGTDLIADARIRNERLPALLVDRHRAMTRTRSEADMPEEMRDAAEAYGGLPLLVPPFDPARILSVARATIRDMAPPRTEEPSVDEPGDPVH